ncbi:hypothetical protein HCG49_15215 [Arenibacter sp. 6A1]|uniref:hypothetical protein n=1 Tax=Arenibacter sp. 6A1 TaxID=2720391 RepID=UPI001446712C|nr:hypothetical protein [Arenibacter sp. 6A1]NKI27911.1 hypothetical protein [Arenibacter sp. 6A1]
MKRILLVLLIGGLCFSCIPLRIAPRIEDYKISQGKKFKRGLPKRQLFLFQDPKEATAFYNFVNSKFQLGDENVMDDVPFTIAQDQYFFSFYEIQIPTKHINFFPLLFDSFFNAALNIQEGEERDPEEIRKDNYYIGIEVYSDFEEDCLLENSLSRTVVLKYLRNLKNEYLVTQQNHEVLFKQ